MYKKVELNGIVRHYYDVFQLLKIIKLYKQQMPVYG